MREYRKGFQRMTSSVSLRNTEQEKLLLTSHLTGMNMEESIESYQVEVQSGSIERLGSCGPGVAQEGGHDWVVSSGPGYTEEDESKKTGPHVLTRPLRSVSHGQIALGMLVVAQL